MAVALILAVVPISALSADGVWDGVMPEANQNAAYSGGSGTQSDPFIIATAEDLAQLSVNAATFSNYSSGKYFLQTDDIVLNPSDVFETDSSGVITGIKEGETANIWTPIGIYISGPMILEAAMTAAAKPFTEYILTTQVIIRAYSEDFMSAILLMSV